MFAYIYQSFRIATSFLAIRPMSFFFIWPEGGIGQLYCILNCDS